MNNIESFYDNPTDYEKKLIIRILMTLDSLGLWWRDKQ